MKEAYQDQTQSFDIVSTSIKNIINLTLIIVKCDQQDNHKALFLTAICDTFSVPEIPDSPTDI